MALITASDLRERFDIDSDIEDARLTPHIASASGRLQKWVPADTYGSTDPLILPILQNAEAHLAMHFAVVGFNSPISAKGVFITETSTEGKAIRRYLAPKEIADLAQLYLDTAQNMVMDLMTTDGTPAAPFETINGSSDCTIDTHCEASTRTCG